MTHHAYISDAVWTPRSKSKKDGSLHEVKSIDLDTSYIDDVNLNGTFNVFLLSVVHTKLLPIVTAVMYSSIPHQLLHLKVYPEARFFLSAWLDLMKLPSCHYLLSKATTQMANAFAWMLASACSLNRKLNLTKLRTAINRLLNSNCSTK